MVEQKLRFLRRPCLLSICRCCCWSSEKSFAFLFRCHSLCGSRKYPYPSHGRFLVCIPPPLRNFRSKGVTMTPLPPGISTLREHGFCCNTYYYNIHFQHITLCYCPILFACLLSGLKCSVFHENLFKPSVVTFS